MSEIYQLPDNNGGNNGGFGNIHFSIPIGGFGSSSSADYLKKELEKIPEVEEPSKKPSKRTEKN